jgi:polyhydroxyalkanoate synthesis regulator phasin|tara:strand:- start:2812 stop:3294 length:483 start_codon:yes stop_codon:yes gene_type:complete
VLKKVKDNLGLFVTGIALMSSVGAGIQSLNAVLSTLTGIDDRMNSIEYEFTSLKESTYVQNDIAVLYEKIQSLEMAAQNVGRFTEEMATLQANLYNLEQQVRDGGFDLDRYYLLEKWEYQELNDSITRMETQVQTVNNNMWELNDLKTRLAYLEANNHNH